MARMERYSSRNYESTKLKHVTEGPKLLITRMPSGQRVDCGPLMAFLHGGIINAILIRNHLDNVKEIAKECTHS